MALYQERPRINITFEDFMEIYLQTELRSGFVSFTV